MVASFWSLAARSRESSLEKLLAYGESLLAVVPVRELVGVCLFLFSA